VSNACGCRVSSAGGAALIPPWAAFECERTGWTLLTMPTLTPASAAARAARCPASPAPITKTSWSGTSRSYIERRSRAAALDSGSGRIHGTGRAQRLADGVHGEHPSDPSVCVGGDQCSEASKRLVPEHRPEWSVFGAGTTPPVER